MTEIEICAAPTKELHHEKAHLLSDECPVDTQDVSVFILSPEPNDNNKNITSTPSSLKGLTSHRDTIVKGLGGCDVNLTCLSKEALKMLSDGQLVYMIRKLLKKAMNLNSLITEEVCSRPHLKEHPGMPVNLPLAMMDVDRRFVLLLLTVLDDSQLEDIGCNHPDCNEIYEEISRRILEDTLRRCNMEFTYYELLKDAGCLDDDSIVYE